MKERPGASLVPEGMRGEATGGTEVSMRRTLVAASGAVSPADITTGSAAGVADGGVISAR